MAPHLPMHSTLLLQLATRVKTYLAVLATHQRTASVLVKTRATFRAVLNPKPLFGTSGSVFLESTRSSPLPFTEVKESKYGDKEEGTPFHVVS
jgi:hypothetical protein